MSRLPSRLVRDALELLIKRVLIAVIWPRWFSDRAPVDPQRVAAHLSANQQGGAP
ncbi:hypothetical protein OL229_10630 [Neisseriaceae bacterium JH1-16]|nr:hypothetical protein [Neisseriaceae bacterium JH1-16]